MSQYMYNYYLKCFNKRDQDNLCLLGTGTVCIEL